ncbi:MAG: hypothetical protein ACP5OG_02080 [Candidatus Nanoarchaeia archaeon]
MRSKKNISKKISALMLFSILFLNILAFPIKGTEESNKENSNELSQAATIQQENNAEENKEIPKEENIEQEIENELELVENKKEASNQLNENNTYVHTEKSENTTKELDNPAIESNQTFDAQNNSSYENYSEFNVYFSEDYNSSDLNNSYEISLTENSKNPNQEKQSTYISIDSIIENSSLLKNNSDEITSIKPENNSNANQEFICLAYNSEGERKIETSIENCNKIKNNETIINSTEAWIKEVIISSQEHFNDSLTFYTNIPELKEKLVKLYWINENKEITIDKDFELNYYDTDNNGLYDRISWSVPHLSEQIFKIIIDFEYSVSSDLEINIISPKNNTKIANPINFKFNISYLSIENLSCNLNINNQTYAINPLLTNSDNLELVNGNYTWALGCFDKENPFVNKTVSGEFYINSQFYLLEEMQKVYSKEEKINISIFADSGNVSLELLRPDNSTIFYSLSEPYPKTQTIDSSALTQKGTYFVKVVSSYLENPRTINRNFTIPEINLEIDKNNILKNQSINFIINISSNEKISSYILDFNDNSAYVTNISVNAYSINLPISHAYANEGTFKPKLAIMIQGRVFYIEKNITVNSSTSDNASPSIELISPEDDSTLEDNSVVFSYKAEDNIRISNCTLEIYNDSGSFGELIYEKTTTDIANNKEINLTRDLAEGEYSWYVFCYDNSSNYNEESKEFKIELESESTTLTTQSSKSSLSKEKTQEVEKAREVIEKINNFLNKSDSFQQEEKQVIDNLKLFSVLNSYKTRLLQIEKDLDSAPDSRKTELMLEVESIESSIIRNLRVISTYQYSKNTVSDNLKEAISTYTKENNIVIDSRALDKLTNANKEIQKNLLYTSSVKQVEIEDSSVHKFTLITKKINVTGESSDTILEFIPSEISSRGVNFTVKSKKITENIYEVYLSDLEDDTIIYSIEGYIEPKELEKTDTFLFKEFVIKDLPITGFAILPGGLNIGYYFFIVLGIIIFIYLTITGIKQKRIIHLKKQENGRKIIKLIKEIRISLKRKELEIARQKYLEIKENYSSLDIDSKNLVYPVMKKIALRINKQDIVLLYKEFRKCKNENRIEDANKIYEKIQTIYKELPEKYRERFYKKFLIKINDK